MRAAASEDDLPNRRLTVAEYYRMGELGVIAPDDRVELLDGELIPMPPIGPDHAYTVDRLTKLFVQRFGDRASARVQGPVRLDDWSEPQPDVMLNALPAARYAAAHPSADETLLIVEVSSTSLAADRGKKLRAYARHGVREYWIVDLNDERVEIYRAPGGERFADCRTAERGESIAPLAFPDDPVAVDDILPARP